MSKLTKLRAEQAELTRSARDLLAQIQSSDAPTEAQIEKIDALQRDLDTVNASIAQLERVASFERALPTIADSGMPQQGARPAEQPSERFASFGDQLTAIMRAGMGKGVDPRLQFAAGPSGASEGAPTEGGYLVQTDFATDILRRTYESAVIASRVRRLPVSANANGLTMNAVDESSRATGSRWGGVRGYWADEAATVTASQPKLRRMELKLHKLMGICYATDELLADGPALQAVTEQAFVDEFAFMLDDAILNGDGVGKPLGIMACGALVTQAAESGPQTAATIVAANVSKMWGRLWARSQSNAVWLVNQDTLQQFPVMTISNMPVYLPPGGLSQAPYGQIFGRPVIPVEQCQTLGTAGDIILADLSQYIVIDKGGMNRAESLHVRFLYDEMTFRFTYRVDGQPVWNKALTPFKGSATQSPFIALASR